MVTAVERRFSTTKVPHAVEWLSDNGSAYIAKDTADTARARSTLLLVKHNGNLGKLLTRETSLCHMQLNF
jgi:transposase InsO family protein